MILFILLCGEPPFNADSDDEIIAKIIKGKFEYKCKLLFSFKHDRRGRVGYQIEGVQRFNKQDA